VPLVATLDSNPEDDVEHSQSLPLPTPSSGTSSKPPFDNTTILIPGSEFVQEAKKDLELLHLLFGGGEWGVEESLSDIDMDDQRALEKASVELGSCVPFEDGFDVVPREDAPLQKKRAQMVVEGGDLMAEEGRDTQTKNAGSNSNPSARAVQMTRLKAMFEPRVEDAGFSILGNLELDLELDDALDVQAVPLVRNFVSEPASSHSHSLPYATPSAPSTSIPLDPARPLFFPLNKPSPSSSDNRPRLIAKGGKNRLHKDVFDVMQESLLFAGASPFSRTGSEEAVGKEWAGRKVELTREWKKRWREAGKGVRRRGGELE